MNPESTLSPEQPNENYNLLDQALNQNTTSFEKGQVVKGRVYEHVSDGAYIDFEGRAKTSGFVPIDEVGLDRVNQDSLEDVLPIGEEVEFMVITNTSEKLLLSRRQLAIKQIWDDLAAIAESGQSVKITVTSSNRGGVIGEVQGGVRGFIPKTHLIQKNNYDELIGKTLNASFLEFDPDNKKLVLSEREAMKADIIGSLKEGTLEEGTVVSIKPYGAFIDINGVIGLLHINQISKGRIENLNDLFQIGDSVRVVILDVDEYKNRISLSLKVLEKHPGEIVENPNKAREIMFQMMNKAEAEERLLESKKRKEEEKKKQQQEEE
jgi:small subunit ribosomal protein S1